MKILHVQETLSPRHGGPATVLPQLASAQAKAGCEVTIATTNADYPSGVYHDAGWDTLPNSSVRVFYATATLSPLQVSLSIARYLRHAIADFDLIHVHGLYRFPTTTAAYLSRRYGVPYIVRPHGSLDPYLYGKSTAGSLRLKRLYERWFDLPNLNAASAIHYTAEEERERASFLDLRSPSFVIPNGLEWQRYEVLPKRGELRERWGLSDAPIVLFLGRLHIKKGLDLLVPAFDAVRQAVPNAQLVIAGPENDDYGQEVRGWVADRGLGSAVHFVGPLQGVDVLRAYVDADVFALPSYTENFGMTVVEAMACALPVVISDQVNIHNEVSRVRAGLVTRCDVDAITVALLAVLRDVESQSAMGAAGRQLVKDRYTWPSIVDSLTAEYELLLTRARNKTRPHRTRSSRHPRNLS